MIAETVLAQLRWVRVSDPNVDLSRFPDFLIVGPQRTGTTWLHANLRFHPQVFLAEPKELFFFSRLKTPDDPRFQSNNLGWYLRFFRDPWWRYLAKTAISLRRYRRLYRPRVRGEATASYATIDTDVIREIALLAPEVKAIMMIRDPVDRAWSHAKKDLVRKTRRRVRDVPDEEFRQFFVQPYQIGCARYVHNYDRWASQLRPGHLRAWLFDDVQRRPEAMLAEVMEFLGVDSDRRYIGDLAREAVNPTASSEVPERHRLFLEELFAEDLRALKERFGLSWTR
ncbi:sulfotransferase [Candidatus Binatia bacterium]|nr:sulfotransferase [Candidatus Binatia bacterium]